MTDYQNQYVNFSATKDLFQKKSLDGTITKVQISKEALPLVKNFLDCSVKTSVRRAINNIPRVSRGENKGKLKRKTIRPRDVWKSPKLYYDPKYVRSSKINEILVDQKTGEKVRVAENAKGSLLNNMDEFIEADVRDFLTYTMPTKTVYRPKFGLSEGVLTRTRIQPYDFRDYDFEVCNWKPDPYY